jgi:hypothetical protein
MRVTFLARRTLLFEFKFLEEQPGFPPETILEAEVPLCESIPGALLPEVARLEQIRCFERIQFLLDRRDASDYS